VLLGHCRPSAVMRNALIVAAGVEVLLDICVPFDVLEGVEVEVVDLGGHARNLDVEGVEGVASRQCEGEREGRECRNQETSHVFTERSGARRDTRLSDPSRRSSLASRPLAGHLGPDGLLAPRAWRQGLLIVARREAA
jgi:hypothetical protein